MTEDDIFQALYGVNDPEVGVIVDLGLVYSREIDSNRVRIVMTITTPACPMHSYLAEEVRAAILDQFENLQSVDVKVI
jgi:metal-sulfur cluster biosynthetic enzyme